MDKFLKFYYKYVSLKPIKIDLSLNNNSRELILEEIRNLKSINPQTLNIKKTIQKLQQDLDVN